MLQRNIEYQPRTVSRVPQGRAMPPAESDALLEIVRSLLRNVRLIVAVTLVGTFIALVVVFTITPQYLATVSILIDPRTTKVLQDAEVVGRPGTDNGAIESEVELLQSDATRRRVAEKLELVRDEEFSRSGGILSTLKAVLLAPLRLISGSKRTGDPLAAVVDKLDKQSGARRRGLTYVIELDAWSQDAEKAAKIANTFADVYLGAQLDAKADATRRAAEWLNRRVDEMRDQVTASERALEEYKAEAGLFSPGGENLSDQQIGQLNEQLIDARAKAAAARSKYEQLKQITPERLRSAAASPDVLGSTVVSNLRGLYADTAREQAEKEARYGPGHPQVTAGRAQVANLERQITAEIRRIVTSAKTEYEMALSRQQSLEASLDELKERAAHFDQAAIRLHALEREAQANKDVFQAFLARSKQTAELNFQVPDSRVISAATVPTGARYPRKGLVLGLAFFGSLGLGMALALARDAFGRRIYRSFEVERSFGLQPLASIPRVGSNFGKRDKPQLEFNPLRLRPPSREELDGAPIPDNAAMTRKLASLAITAPDSAYAESIRTLYQSLKQQSSDGRIGAVLVTSALPGEGKSTVAANLARTAAMAGDDVLLIDGDLRRPSLANALDCAGEPGLAELLRGEVDLQSSVQRDERSGLYVISGMTHMSGGQALATLSSDRMAHLIDSVRKIFDLVVIDAAPLLPVADSKALLRLVDGAVLVVASDRTSKDAIATAIHESRDVDDKFVGIVLNGTVDDIGRYATRYHADSAAAPT